MGYANAFVLTPRERSFISKSVYVLMVEKNDSSVGWGLWSSSPSVILPTFPEIAHSSWTLRFHSPFPTRASRRNHIEPVSPYFNFLPRNVSLRVIKNPSISSRCTAFWISCWSIESTISSASTNNTHPSRTISMALLRLVAKESVGKSVMTVAPASEAIATEASLEPSSATIVVSQNESEERHAARGASSFLQRIKAVSLYFRCSIGLPSNFLCSP